MTPSDESIYETLGDSMAYRVFWTRFGQGALLTLLAAHGNPSSNPQASRRLLCEALRGSLRALREEMLFPFSHDMPRDPAKIATAAFHKTFRHLEEGFWMKAALLSPDLVQTK